MVSRIGGGQPFIQQPSSPSSNIVRAWDFVSECIFKEFGSCLRHVWYRTVFWIDPHKHDINPTTIKTADKTDQIAKVVLLLHGAGAHQSSFVPLAKEFSKAKIRNIYTVTLNQSDKDPVPTKDLDKRIKEITQSYVKRGYKNVDFSLVGHSLGALVASKYIWRVGNPQVSMMVSIAGRLKYVPNKFSWFCEDVKPEITKTFEAFSRSPDKVGLYTIWGDQDGIVPRKSVHIQGNSSREHTVKGWGHGGVVFAPGTHKKVVSLTKEWL